MDTVRIRHEGPGYNETAQVLKDGTMGVGLMNPGDERDVSPQTAARLMERFPEGWFVIVAPSGKAAPEPKPTKDEPAKVAPRARPEKEQPRQGGRFVSREPTGAPAQASSEPPAEQEAAAPAPSATQDAAPAPLQPGGGQQEALRPGRRLGARKAPGG